MRQILLLLHRYVGLLIAGFLVISGLTGAVISWDHELDELLNAHLIHARGHDTSLQKSASSAHPSPLSFVAGLEKRHPEVRVVYVPLAVEEGHSLDYWVDPLIDPKTMEPAQVGFNQVFVDPDSGEEQGRREWGAVWPLSTETFVSFLYRLHFSLQVPEMWGIDRWGVWLMGVVALLWTLDCFVAFCLTLPARKKQKSIWGSDWTGEVQDQVSSEQVLGTRKSFWMRWKTSWLVRTRGGSYKLNFDLHRAGGLWTWGLLFVVAFTGFSMNLYDEVFEPTMSMVSDVTPTIWSQREERPRQFWDTVPGKTFEEIVALAPLEAKKRGWSEPPGSIYYSRERDMYQVTYYFADNSHGTAGGGNREIFFDATDGHVLSTFEPWTGTVADIFLQSQFPLHSGRILAIPGRILISLMGLVVAMLSVTGVYVWYKKRLARSRAELGRQQRQRSGFESGGFTAPSASGNRH